jgi:cellulose synthase/poly-beta-1,6-N-acetylglucosamine synthase-like glycosyltransferase
MILSIIILISGAVYFLINLTLIISTQIEIENPDSEKSASISVIIAAKNEEDNIIHLIDSLIELSYNKEKYEVIIIDDSSSDKTFETTLKAIKGHTNFHIYQAHDKIFPAKKGALAFGINLASNPFILITDADCRPQKNWLYHFSKEFNNGYDFIFGISPFYQDKSTVNKTACFENLRNSLLTFSAAQLSMPYCAAARSFGFKKSSFEKIKGYSNTIDTLSGDDDLLLREAVKNHLRVGTIFNHGAFVYSACKKTWKEYFRQRSRHTKTSIYYLARHKIFLGSWHTLNLVMLFSPILCLINISYLFLLIFKIIVDAGTVLFIQKKFGYRFKLWEIIYLQIFYELMIILNFANAVYSEDVWQ